eukprot:scaffold24027_cov132-Cylindrotheca_fusiformis.AAC.2
MITEATSTGDALPAEDDDKGGKLRRRRQSQARSIGACLGLFCFLLLVLMVKMNHHDKYTPSKLRRHNRHSDPVAAAALEAKGVGEVVGGTFLPPDSIYRLSVPDMSGNLVSLEKYSGMVSLIVNVACL